MQGQTTYSTYSPRPGNTRTSWLTGAAAWSYWSATQSILGLRPEVDGLRIDPCIPSAWPGFKATRQKTPPELIAEIWTATALTD